MKKRKYCLIDDQKGVAYFILKLKDEFIPIVVGVDLKLMLEAKGIETLDILEFVKNEEISLSQQGALKFGENFLTHFDDHNSVNYSHVFKTKGFNLARTTMHYGFNYYISNCLLIVIGLRSLVEKLSIKQLFYLYDQKRNKTVKYVGSSGFCYRDDTVIRLFNCWDFTNKPKLNLLPPRVFVFNKKNSHFIVWLKSIFSMFRYHLKQLLKISQIDPAKKTILFLAPHYNFSSLLGSNIECSRELEDNFNLVAWQLDKDFIPNQIKKSGFGNSIEKNVRKRLKHCEIDKLVSQIEQTKTKLNFNDNSEGVDLGKFSAPLIVASLKKEIRSICRAWFLMETLKQKLNLSMVVWGNSPVALAHSVIVEYAKLHKIKVVGMQHGGAFGSNQCLSHHFVTDYSRCNYFLTYGFTEKELRKNEKETCSNIFPKFLPVGSSTIKGLKSRIASKGNKRLKVLFPLSTFNASFLSMSAFEKPIIKRVALQQKIIGLLNDLAQEHSCLVSFPPNLFKYHPLKNKLPVCRGVQFSKDVPFSCLLQQYEADWIIFDGTSTALLEAVGSTKSNLLVYNDQNFLPLETYAKEVLEKRAYVFDSEDELVNKIKAILLDESVEIRDLKDCGFEQKYCLAEGDPLKNMVSALVEIGANIYV